MARKTTKKRRRRKTTPKRYTRRRRKTVPIEMFVGAGSIPFVGARTGYGSILNCVQRGDWTGVADNLVCGFTPVYQCRGAVKGIDVFNFINPFNFEQGRFMKILLWSGIAGMLRKKLIGRYTSNLFRRIPIIGRWVS